MKCMEVFERATICIFRESCFFLGRTIPFFRAGKCSIDEHGVDKCFMNEGGVNECCTDEERYRNEKAKCSLVSTGERERERARERERETDRQTDRQRQRDRDRETERDRDRETGREGGWEWALARNKINGINFKPHVPSGLASIKPCVVSPLMGPANTDFLSSPCFAVSPRKAQGRRLMNQGPRVRPKQGQLLSQPTPLIANDVRPNQQGPLVWRPHKEKSDCGMEGKLMSLRIVDAFSVTTRKAERVTGKSSKELMA